MQAVTARYGPSPQAFIVVPMIGAFFIDLLNAFVIQGFLMLPIHGF
jgi:ESS family glutamate:Na+ symporter